jgi:hypothetical protein
MTKTNYHHIYQIMCRFEKLSIGIEDRSCRRQVDFTF